MSVITIKIMYYLLSEKHLKEDMLITGMFSVGSVGDGSVGDADNELSGGAAHPETGGP